MPNRILKDSIRTSDSINELNWFEEVLFYRLIVSCDDYGRFDGRPAIVKNLLFPLKETLTVKAVTGAINKLATVGLVSLYVFEGKQYLQLPTWNHHQTARAKQSKYPAPPEGSGNVQAHENICMQTISDDKQSQTDDRKCARYSNSNSIFDIRYSNSSNAGEPPADPPPEEEKADVRHKYGEYGNVLLSDAELDKLKAEFPDDWSAKIENLSSYIASTGKKYKSHLATIRNWARMDKQKTGKTAAPPVPKGTFVIGEGEIAAVKRLERYLAEQKGEVSPNGTG